MSDRDEDARPPAEGVRIIGAEEAQAALEGGHASGRLPDDELRFGDVPPRPDADRAAVRFPLPEDASPALGASAPAPLGPPGHIDLTDSTAAAPTEAPSAGRRSGASRPARARAANAPKAGGTATVPRAEHDPATEELPAARESESGSSAAPLPHWTEPPTGEVPDLGLAIDAPPPTEGDAPGDAVDDELDVWTRFTSAPRYRDQPSDWAEQDFAPGDLGDESTRVGALREHVDADTEFNRALAQLRPGDAAANPATTGPRPRRASLEPDAPTPVPPPTTTAKRDLPTAIVVGLAIFVGALLIFTWGRAPAAVLVAAIAGMAIAEFYAAIRSRGYQPATLLGIVGASGIVLATYWKGEPAIAVTATIMVVFTLLWYLVQVFPGRPTINAAFTLLGFGYVGGLAGFAGLLLHDHNGTGLLLGAAIPAAAYDIGGYGFGSWLGSRKLAPTISPNKTVEGLVGGIVSAVVVAAVIVGFIAPWNHAKSILLGLVVAVFAVLGDLCESMFKRDLGVKDLGGLLPGHGGVLDRFDAIIFALPAVYFLARAFNIA